MTQLIPIQKTLLNNEAVNSANARDLHEHLNISKHFTQWIEAQIKRADLKIDRDYFLFNQKVNQVSGAKHLKQYILTIESAKHIAMMSQSKKAKEIRDYFIEVERKYIDELKHGSLQFQTLQAELTQHLDQRLDTFEEKFEEFSIGGRQVSLQLSQSSRVLSEATKAIQDLPLDKDQLRVLREKVTECGRSKAQKIGITSETAIPALFIKLNKHFDVSSYHEIPRSSYYLAMRFVSTIQL